MCLVWNKAGSNQKYLRPQTMFKTVKHFISFFKDKFGPAPFRFYIDARFSSLALCAEFRKAGFGYVMSLGSNAKPKTLMKWLVADLEKREWRTVTHKDGGTFTGIRAKSKAYVRLLTNFASAKAVQHVHHRRKYPTASFPIICPDVQVQYNAHKNGLDNFNRLMLSFYRTGHLTHEDELFFRFFIHAHVVRSFIYWRKSDPGRSSEVQKKFRLSVLQQLLSEFSEESPASQPRLQSHPAHWPSKVPTSRKFSRCPQPGCCRRISIYCAGCRAYMCSKCVSTVHIRFIATKFP